MDDDAQLTEYGGGGGGGGDTDRVSEWELGLPSSSDLTPLSHRLIPPELAAAFSISPEPHRTAADVHRASQGTLSSLRGGGGKSSFESDPPPNLRRPDDGGAIEESSADAADAKSAASKRPRLVWTPQLHKRFVDVVAHLGIKNAVPKTIMQMMNVEGLTRENVASHLQKYRLYLKRMQGISDDGPSSSDHLFSSTPIPNEFENGRVAMPVMMQVPMMMPGHGSYPWIAPSSSSRGY